MTVFVRVCTRRVYQTNQTEQLLNSWDILWSLLVTQIKTLLINKYDFPDVAGIHPYKITILLEKINFKAV